MRKNRVSVLAVGAAFGAVLGAIELWFFKFDLKHLVAAVVAGACYGVVMTVTSETAGVKMGRGGMAFAGATAGACAAAIWWLIARPDTSLGLALVIGVAFGVLVPVIGL